MLCLLFVVVDVGIRREDVVNQRVMRRRKENDITNIGCRARNWGKRDRETERQRERE